LDHEDQVEVCPEVGGIAGVSLIAIVYRFLMRLRVKKAVLLFEDLPDRSSLLDFLSLEHYFRKIIKPD